MSFIYNIYQLNIAQFSCFYWIRQSRTFLFKLIIWFRFESRFFWSESRFGSVSVCFCGTAPNVYAVIRCESNTVRSRVFKEAGNPEFNLRAIFYRRYPGAHISIEVQLTRTTQGVTVCECALSWGLLPVQVWSSGTLWDAVLGRTRLQTARSERSRRHLIELKGSRARSWCKGRVHVETSSSVCLTDLWLTDAPSFQLEAARGHVSKRMMDNEKRAALYIHLEQINSYYSM